jgi:hypothetical protein
MNLNETMQSADDNPAPSMEELEGEGGGEFVEPRRPRVSTSTMLMIGLLAAVGGATYLMCMKASAQSLTVDPTVAAAAATINAFLKGGDKEQYQLAAVQRDTEKIVAQFNSYPSARQVPLNDLHGNPFRSADDDQPASVPEDKRKAIEDSKRQAAESVVKNLILESIVFGDHSLCMINGRPYAEGQGNGAFTIDRINESSVWVRVGDLRVELKMKPQGLD